MAMDKRIEALLETKRRLDNAGIEFCLGHGTCLGAYRDKALIDDDHDIDIWIFNRKIKDVRKILKWPVSRRTSGKLDELTFIPSPGVRVDVCCWQKVGNEYHLNFKPKSNRLDRLPEKFAEFKQIEFLGHTFLIPKHTEEYLVLYYGETWKKKIKGKPARAPINMQIKL